MMQQLNQQAGQARRRGRRTLIVIAAVAVVLAGLAAVTCGYARLHFFPSAVAGIQTDRVARSASGEVILSEPVVSPAGAIEYGQDTVFQLTVASSGAADEVVVLLGDGPQPAVHLNDIGWPPDEQSFDGVWTGRLDWGAYRRSGRDLAVRFEYRREGRPAAALDCGAISVTESGVRITSFDCQPQGAVTVFDDLMLTAAMGSPDLPGSVVALVGGLAEAVLHDDGAAPDEQARDGVYSAGLAVPCELEYGRDTPVVVEYRASTGEVVASMAGPKVALQPPEVYLAGFSCRPERPLEIGEPLTVRALLNRGEEQLEVDIKVFKGETLLRGMPTTLDGRVLVDGRREFQGQWEGPLTWPHELTEPGADYFLTASIFERGRVVSRRRIGPLELRAPQIEITGARFDPPPPWELGQLAGVQAHTDRPAAAGKLRLSIGGFVHSRLVDDGSHHDEGSFEWWDEVKQDGEWAGVINWHASGHTLEPGRAQPARLEYVLGEQVLASYELEPVTINESGIRIASFYREPEGPVRLGQDVRFIIDLNRAVTIGRLDVTLADGTVLAGGGDVKGARVTLKMQWHKLQEPGDYGPVTAQYRYSRDIRDKVDSELADAPLVVVE